MPSNLTFMKVFMLDNIANLKVLNFYWFVKTFYQEQWGKPKKYHQVIEWLSATCDVYGCKTEQYIYKYNWLYNYILD